MPGVYCFQIYNNHSLSIKKEKPGFLFGEYPSSGYKNKVSLHFEHSK